MVRASTPPSTTTRGEFGPYPYGHLSFVERPGNGTGMHAEASMVTFTEGIRSLGAERRSGEPQSPVRGRRPRDGPPVDGPVRTCRGCTGDVGEPCLVLRDEGRGARQGVGLFGGFCASCGSRIHTRRFAAVNRCSVVSTRTCPIARALRALCVERVHRRGASEWRAAAPARDASTGSGASGDDARSVS